MRTITLIIIHCSATPEGKDYTVEDIDRWHRARGWKGIGYHYVIYRDGSIHKGRPEEMVGAHCKNHNKYSLGICYIGGLEDSPKALQGSPLLASPPALPTREGAKANANAKAKDTRTPEQKLSLLSLLSSLKKKYPRAIIVSHHDLNPQKSCPCFDATTEYLQL